MMTWSERKPQSSKLYHREENNEPLVLPTKAQPWMDRVLAPLPLLATDEIIVLWITSKLVTLIWKMFRETANVSEFPLYGYVCFFFILKKEIISFQPWIFVTILQTFKGIWITQKQTLDLSWLKCGHINKPSKFQIIAARHTWLKSLPLSLSHNEHSLHNLTATENKSVVTLSKNKNVLNPVFLWDSLIKPVSVRRRMQPMATGCKYSWNDSSINRSTELHSLFFKQNIPQFQLTQMWGCHIQRDSKLNISGFWKLGWIKQSISIPHNGHFHCFQTLIDKRIHEIIENIICRWDDNP